jgi:creatinine amidohydrolase
MDRAVAGNTEPIADLMPRLRVGGVRAVSSSGVLGDPTAATAADGARLLAALAGALVRHVAAWVPA